MSEEIHPKQKLGRLIDEALSVSKMADGWAAALVGVSYPQGWTNVKMGIIPLTQIQIDKLCKRLDIDSGPMLEAAREWYTAPVDEVKVMGLEVTKVTSRILPSARDMLDELLWILQDLQHGANVLETLSSRVFGSSSEIAFQTSSQLKAAADRASRVLAGFTRGHVHPSPVPEDQYGPPVERFEVGKVYRHPSGKVIKIVGEVETVGYGTTLVAEDMTCPNLLPIGSDAMAAEHWWEIRESAWWLLWLEANPGDKELDQKLRDAIVKEETDDGWGHR